MAQSIFQTALETYSPKPPTEEIRYARQNLDLFLNERLPFESLHSFTCVVTDPGEEFDDLMMLRYGVYNTIGDVIVVISAGYFTPQERLDYLIDLFPCFQGAKFGETLETPYGGHILFVSDGELVPYKIKRFINCGPCSSTTLQSIEFEESPIVVTVGANDDGTLSAGINQKQTDEPNKLVQIPGIWNNFIEKAKSKNAVIRNISVNVSRYVLFPNPLKVDRKSPLYNLDPRLINVMIKTTAMFITSRPPAQVGLRANEGNSIIDIQMYNVFDPTSKRYQQGLKKIEEYAEIAKSKGLNSEYYVSAAIPIMLTYCMGGVYKEGMFGFSPTDREAKETIGCITSESADLLIESIKRLKYLTPGYDPLAYIEAFWLN
jgi:hypothetical protein